MGGEIVSEWVVSEEALNTLVICSRPKSVNDIAHQDEVVAVLKKSVKGADVSRTAIHTHTRTLIVSSGSQPAVLWPPWDRQDLSHPSHVPGVVWDRPDEASCPGTERIR